MFSRSLFAAFALSLGLGSATLAAEGYTSLWAQTQRSTRAVERGSLTGDFQRAAAATSLKSAAARWSAFLRRHAPAAGEEADDAMQNRFARIARIELARVYYLQQRPVEGDRLIKDLIAKP